MKKVPPPTKPKPNLRRHIGGDGKENQERDPLAVYCRIRPPKLITDLRCIRPRSDKVIQMVTVNGMKTTEFTFEHVFTELSSQKEVFQSVCLPLIQDVVDGKNALLFTYGITSSGKTHTISGRPSDPGILPRTLDTLFSSIQEYQARRCAFKSDNQNGFYVQSPAEAILEWQAATARTGKTPITPGNGRFARQRRQDAQDLKDWNSRTRDDTSLEVKHKHNAYAVFLSYVEIYNNYIYDLLDDSAMDQLRVQPRQPISKTIREDATKKQVFVVNCTEIEVCTADEAFEVFLRGVRRRRMAHTALNAESSRSHSVFNIKVVQSPVDADNEVSQNTSLIAVSQLSLVDLAGCERTGRTGTTGERLREAGNINNSLMGLRQCIDIMRENQKNSSNKVIPYRDHKLTHLFKNYFEGEGKVRMIICVNPSADEYEETINVMKFAEVSQEVTVGRAADVQFLPLPQGYHDFATDTINFATLRNVCRPPPTNVLTDINDESVIPEWLHWLDEHKNAHMAKANEIRHSQLMFRKQVVDMEQENLFLRQKVEQLNNDIEARCTQIRLIESEKDKMIRETSKFERIVAEYKEQIRCLDNKLASKDTIINDLTEERDKLRETYQDKFRAEQSRLQQIYDQRLREVERKLQDEKCVIDEKLHLVKHILYAKSDDQLRRISKGLTNFN